MARFTSCRLGRHFYRGGWSDIDASFVGKASSTTISVSVSFETDKARFFRVARLTSDAPARIAFLGDSITNQLNHPSYPRFINLCGYPCWLRWACQARFAFVPRPSGELDWGYGGRSAAQILADGRVDELLSQCVPGDVVFVLLGINDVAQGYSVEEVVGNVIAVWDAIRESGRQVVGSDILPRNDPEGNVGLGEINALLQAAAAARGITYVPWWPALMPETADNYQPPYMAHPNPLGASRAATFAAPYLVPILGPRPEVPEFYTGNPVLSGANGQAPPTGWTVSTSLTCSDYSYIPAGDGRGDWLEVTLTNADDGVARGFTIYRRDASSGWEGASGVSASCDFEVVKMSGNGVRNLYLRMHIDRTVDEYCIDGMLSSTDAAQLNDILEPMPDIPNGQALTRSAQPVVAPDLDPWQLTRPMFSVVLHPGSVVTLRLRNLGCCAN